MLTGFGAAQNARIGGVTDSQNSPRSRAPPSLRRRLFDLTWCIRLSGATLPATPSRALFRLTADAFSEKFVDCLRIGCAAGRLHHLTDKPADRLRIGFRV